MAWDSDPPNLQADQDLAYGLRACARRFGSTPISCFSCQRTRPNARTGPVRFVLRPGDTVEFLDRKTKGSGVGTSTCSAATDEHSILKLYVYTTLALSRAFCLRRVDEANCCRFVDKEV